MRSNGSGVFNHTDRHHLKTPGYMSRTEERFHNRQGRRYSKTFLRKIIKNGRWE